MYTSLTRLSAISTTKVKARAHVTCSLGLAYCIQEFSSFILSTSHLHPKMKLLSNLISLPVKFIFHTKKKIVG